MPQIGWFELLIVVLVAILIIGPKDFPVVLRKLGSWIGSTKKYFSDIQNIVEDIVFKNKIGRIRDIQIHPSNGKLFFLSQNALWLMEKN